MRLLTSNTNLLLENSNIRNKLQRPRETLSVGKYKEKVRFDISDSKPRSKSFARDEEPKISNEESKSSSDNNLK